MIKVACILLAISMVRASDVVQLGDSDFESRMSQFDFALVKFYAPWCGHCKKLAPEFDRASEILKEDDPPVTLVKVDCTEDGKDTCSKFDVKGFPTLKIFKQGTMTMEYQGPREADGIVQYLRSKAGPSYKNLKSEEALNKFTKPEPYTIAVGGFFSDESSAQAKDFTKLADALSEDYRFALVTEPSVLEKSGYKDQVVVFRSELTGTKLEGARTVYDGEITLSAVKKFLNTKAHGLAGLRNARNSEQFPRPVAVVYFDLDYTLNPKGTNYYRNRILKVAKKMSEAGKNINFAASKAEDTKHELEEMNLKFDEKPVVGIRDASNQKFVMTTEFSMDNLEAFVNDFLDGKLEPYMKSEALPEDNSGPVKTVVARNFNEIVNDPERDVLIEFYAPWCGHCKSLAPKYEELGEKLANDPTVTIAKMDATANDVPPTFQVQGFPTIFYAPKNSKSSPKKYEGGREVKDFLKYLAKESTDGLKGYDRNGKKKKSEL